MYAKVFQQIYDSSIAEDWQVRLVFMDLLVLADKDGIVDVTAEAIARRTNVPLDLVKRGLCKLCQPDSASRTSDHDGRRILLLDEHRDWGWQIVNFATYHKLRDENERREYMRTYMRERRAREQECKQPVNTVNSSKQQLAHAHADVYEDINTDTAETDSAPTSAKAGSKPAKPKSETIKITWTREGGFTGIVDDDRTAWGQAYPACNLDTQFARMGEWLKSNAAKAHKSNWRKFITNWLGRSQDKGGDPGGAGGVDQGQALPETDAWFIGTCEAFGLRPVTEADKRRASGLAGDFREKCDFVGVGPDEIIERRKALSRLWGMSLAAVTPETTLKHWDAAGDAEPDPFAPRDLTPEELAWEQANIEAIPEDEYIATFKAWIVAHPECTRINPRAIRMGLVPDGFVCDEDGKVIERNEVPAV